MSEAKCGLCGDPMPAGEEMFMYHGYSGPCPKPPVVAVKPPRLSSFTLLFAKPEHLPAGVDFGALLRVLAVDYQKGEIHLAEEKRL